MSVWIPHLAPHPPFLAQRIVIGQGVLAVVEIAAAGTQSLHDEMRVERREITHQQDIVATTIAIALRRGSMIIGP